MMEMAGGGLHIPKARDVPGNANAMPHRDSANSLARDICFVFMLFIIF
jgi:hypothetical protein